MSSDLGGFGNANGSKNGSNGTSGEQGPDGTNLRGREPRVIQSAFAGNESSDEDFSTDDENGPLAAVLLPLVPPNQIPPQNLPQVPDFNLPQVAGVNFAAVPGQMLGGILQGVRPALPVGGEVLLHLAAAGQAAVVGGQGGQVVGGQAPVVGGQAAVVGGQAGEAVGVGGQQAEGQEPQQPGDVPFVHVENEDGAVVL